MKIDINTIGIVLTAFFVLLGLALHSKRGRTSFDKIKETIKEPLLMLFLYAQKKDITGPEKMEWCIQVIMSKINIEIDEAYVREFAQYLYDKSIEYVKEALNE